MPQFDPEVWSPQIIWLIISFVVLYFLMARLALPRISDVLEEREFRINDSLRKAEGLKQDAEDAIAAYEHMMSEARAKAQAQVRAAKEEAAAQAAARHAELTERLAHDITAAETRIVKAREEATAGIRDMAIDVVGLAAERLIGQKPPAESVSTAISKAMGESR